MEITELLNIKYPLFQGAMANISDGTFAATVSNAGGLGIIGTGSNDAKWLKKEIVACRKMTRKPFGVNVVLLSPFANELIDLIIKERIKVITTGAGNPSQYMERLKAAGVKVIPVVASVSLAKRMEKMGADAIIAEGTESGGHVGEITTMALVPQVVDAVKIPVIAAGGIADNRGVAASYMLGAKGIQIGTAFLATIECPIHDNYKRMIIQATDSSTVVTGRGIAPVRVIKNPMALEYLKIMRETELDTIRLEKLTIGSLKNAIEFGDIDAGSFMAGQIAGLVKELRTVEEVIEDLFIGIDDYISSVKVIK